MFTHPVSTATQEGTRRQRSRQKKVEAIRVAAMEIVATGGLPALTIQELAARLDWAAGALYRYFPSKDALLAELQCRTLAAYGDDLDRELERAGRDRRLEPLALGSLLLVARHYAAWLGKRPAEHTLISAALGDPRVLLSPGDGERVMQEVVAALARVAVLMEDAAASGNLSRGSAQERTLAYWASVQGVLQLRKLTRHAPRALDADRLLRECVRALLVGWGANPRELETASALVDGHRFRKPGGRA